MSKARKTYLSIDGNNESLLFLFFPLGKPWYSDGRYIDLDLVAEGKDLIFLLRRFAGARDLEEKMLVFGQFDLPFGGYCGMDPMIDVFKRPIERVSSGFPAIGNEYRHHI